MFLFRSFATLICFGKYVAKLLNSTNQNIVDNRFRNLVYCPVIRAVCLFLMARPVNHRWEKMNLNISSNEHNCNLLSPKFCTVLYGKPFINPLWFTIYQ